MDPLILNKSTKMKNGEAKNRISSIYPSPRPITPSAEDLLKQELENEMRKVEKDSSEEFTIEQNTYTNTSSHFQSETKKLKIMLNKLTCSNKVKSDKLEALKNLLILNQKQMQNPSSTSKLIESIDKLETLRNKFEETEDENKKQLNENEMLVEMKNKETKEIISLKEKLSEALNSMDKVSSLNEQKQIFSHLIKLQNSSAQQILQESKKFLQKTQENFTEEFAAMHQKKVEQDKRIKKCIEKISKANIKSRETRTAISRIQMSLEEQSILALDNNIQIRKSKSKIMEIRSLLALLQKHCNDCPKFSEPLTKIDIDFIVSSYSKIRFQEHSLSLKFGNLTEEQIDKQRKCDHMNEELRKIKNDEEVDTKYPKDHRYTFNELKSLLEDKKIIETKHVIEQSQKLILRIYLKILSIGNFFSKSLTTIGLNSKYHSNDNSVLMALDEIKSLQRSPKNRQTSGFLVKRKLTKQLEKKKTYKTDLEPNEDYHANKLNPAKIKDFLKKFIEKKAERAKFGAENFDFNLIDSEQCISLISHDLLACFFVDINDLDSKSMENINDSKSLIREINVIGINSFRSKFNTLVNALSEVAIFFKGKTSSLKTEIVEFCIEQGPETTEFIEKGLNKYSFKTLMKYLLENSEKFESRQNKKKASEDTFSNVFSTNSVADDQSVKSRVEMPTADKTARTHQSFNFTMASVHSAIDTKAFGDKIKSYSTRNLIHEARRIKLSPVCNYYGDPLRTAFKKK